MISVALGLGLRFLAIGIPDPNIDEAGALYFAKFPLPQQLSQLSSAGFLPWAFPAVIHLWGSMLGIDPVVASTGQLVLFWSIGCLIYLLVAWNLWRLGEQLAFDRRSHGLIQLVLATSFYFVDLNRELRPYGLLFLLQTLAFRTCLYAAASGRLAEVLKWASLSAASFAFGHFAILTTLGQALFLLREWRFRGRLIQTLIVGFSALIFLSLPTAAVLWRTPNLFPPSFSPSNGSFSALVAANFVGEIFTASFPRAANPYAYRWATVFACAGWIFLVGNFPRRYSELGRALLFSNGPSLFFLVASSIAGRTFFSPGDCSGFAIAVALVFAVGVQPFSPSRPVRWVGTALAFCILINAFFFVRHQIVHAKNLVRQSVQMRPLPSPRMSFSALRPYSESVQSSICRGEAVFSDGYARLELLLHHCPKAFNALTTLDERFLFSNGEWAARKLRVIAFHRPTPWAKWVKEREAFFIKYATRGLSDYSQFRVGRFDYWIDEDLLPEKPIVYSE